MSEPERQRDRRELLDPNGLVLGTMWGVWSDEPCWEILHDAMFWKRFRLEPSEAFATYGPLFEGLVTEARRDRERFKVSLGQSRLRRKVGQMIQRLRGSDASGTTKSRALRQRIYESIRIREANGEVWRPVVIWIDGECGYFRITGMPGS